MIVKEEDKNRTRRRVKAQRKKEQNGKMFTKNWLVFETSMDG